MSEARVFPSEDGTARFIFSFEGGAPVLRYNTDKGHWARQQFARRQAIDLASFLLDSAEKMPVPGATLHCAFCGKSQHEVRKLIAGPAVFICDECVDLCHAIVAKAEGGDG